MPLALYVHVPWCVAKCPYCDFNSHALKGAAPGARFNAAVLADLDFELALRPAAGPLVSVFLGGGTPSLLRPDTIGRLLEGIGRRIGLAEGAEVTLEANPGTVERGCFGDYAAAGVNRISLGAQSFEDEMLRRLGRIHRSGEAVSAIEELHECGFENFNLDLMYSLPGQTAAGALADVECATGFAPAHISYYELTIEPGTAFQRRPPVLPSEAESERIEFLGRERLARAGYARYEVSAFARPGRRSVHNENYWQFGDYIGIGPGAHGKRSEGGRIVRTARIRSPDRYLRLAGGAGAVEAERGIDGPERVFEFLLNGLRRVEGFGWEQFELRTGSVRGRIEPRLRDAAAEGLLALDTESVRATPRGLDCLNEILCGFLPVRRSVSTSTAVSPA